MEEEDKPRPAANEEEAPQESADPPEAEKANETPSTELKRWAHPFLHRKNQTSPVWAAKNTNFGHLVAVDTHKKTTATLEQIALQNVFLFVSVTLNNFLKEKKNSREKLVRKILKWRAD